MNRGAAEGRGEGGRGLRRRDHPVHRRDPYARGCGTHLRRDGRVQHPEAGPGDRKSVV